MKTKVQLMPITSLVLSDTQSDKRSNDLDGLVDSIREHGVLQPLIVRASKDTPDTWEIIAGRRRLAAASAAGLSQVPVLVIEADDKKSLDVQLHENLHRRDLDPFEECELYELMQECGSDVADIAARAARPESYITRRLALALMPAVARKAVAAGGLSFAVAEVLVTVTDKKEREDLAKAFIDRVPGNVREAIGALRYRTDRREIDHAPFDVKDTTMAPEGSPCRTGDGSCGACPFNSVASGSMLALLGQDPDRGGTCLNAAGWKSKVTAAKERFTAAIAAEGGTMLSAAQAKKAARYGQFYPEDLGLMDLASDVYDGAGKIVKARKLIEGDAPPVIGHVTDDGRMLRLVKRSDVPSLARKRDAAVRTSPSERNDRVKREDESRVNAQLLQEIKETDERKLRTPEVDRWLLQRMHDLCGGHENMKALAIAFEYKNEKMRPDLETLDKALQTVVTKGSAKEVRAMVLIFAALERWGGLNTKNASVLAALVGVDVKQIEGEVRAARAAKVKLLKARETKRAAKAAKKATRGKVAKKAKPRTAKKRTAKSGGKK